MGDGKLAKPLRLPGDRLLSAGNLYKHEPQFAPPRAEVVAGLKAASSRVVEATDMDRDGDIDFIVLSPGRSEWSYYFVENQSVQRSPAARPASAAPRFAKPRPETSGGPALIGNLHQRPFVRDMNGDGVVDVVDRVERQIVYYQGERLVDGGIAFANAATPLCTLPTHNVKVTEIADSDRDGDWDLRVLMNLDPGRTWETYLLQQRSK